MTGRRDARIEIVDAHRRCAQRHPRAYAATGRIAGVQDERFLAAGAAVVEPTPPSRGPCGRWRRAWPLRIRR